jgi:predicted nucleotidyltransferase
MLKRILAKALPHHFVEALVQSELTALLRLCDPRKVYLFGSAARGTMTDASDIDLLVVLKDGTDIKRVKRSYYCRKKEHLVPVDIIFIVESDFISRSKIGGIPMVCASEGRLIFEATP